MRKYRYSIFYKFYSGVDIWKNSLFLPLKKGKIKVKSIKKLFLTALCMCLFAVVFSVTAFAEKQTLVWDGKSELTAGNTYVITETVKLHKTFEVPEGTKLSVKKGGELKIYRDGGLTVKGELAVAQGGKLVNSGTINIKKSAAFNIYGTFQSSVSGTLKISGDMTVYKQGTAEISSKVLLYKSSYVYIKGSTDFYKSSDTTLSGVIKTEKSSSLSLGGKFAVTLNGSVDVYGHLKVGTKSDVKISGVFTLEADSSYTRFKTVYTTKNGKFIDYRPEDVYYDMTINILTEEKEVVSKGIDVSYAQGDIDWKKVADSGVEFAIIRAGRGRAGSTNTMKEDDYFRQNIKGAQENGIDVGVYFYSYATSVSEAKEEARFLLSIIDGYKIQYPVILDMEEEFQSGIGTKKLTKMIEAFFEVLMEENYFPMFYSYKSWLENNLDMTILDKYAIWLAQVGDEVTYDGGYYIWQYSFKGKVDGISTDVDLDYSYRDFPTILKKYGLNNL